MDFESLQKNHEDYLKGMTLFQRSFISAVMHQMLRMLGRVSFWASCRCVLCNKKVQFFLPYQGGSRSVPPLLRELRTVGSDPDHFECPACGCHDRERHAFMYLSRLGLVGAWRGQAILHFAPESHLRRLIQNHQPALYICADISPHEPSVARMSIEAIPHDGNTFDFIIANHVLEHVDNYVLALQEIYRCLKPGGLALLQVPYSESLHTTFEDPGVETPLARLNAFGQEDHLRLFGRDVVNRLCSTGLVSRVRQHEDLLPDVDATVFGVNRRESLLLFQKPY